MPLFYTSLVGTGSADVIFVRNGTSLDAKGGNGNDILLGYMGNFLADTSIGMSSNHSIGIARELNSNIFWSTDANLLVGDDSIPHVTIYDTFEAGESAAYYTIDLAAGSEITLDIDAAAGNLGTGLSTDTTIQILASDGTVLVTSYRSSTALGGEGSVSRADPYVTFAVPEDGTYYIVVSIADGGVGTGEEDYVLNVSLPGHGLTSLSQAPGVASLYGGDGDDLLLGSALTDYAAGGPGDDRILGDGGNDGLHGKRGADAIFGGEGEDGLFGGSGDDYLFGGDADNLGGDTEADNIYGEKGDDYIIGGVNDSVDGGPGFDTLSFEHSSSWVVVDLLGTNEQGAAGMSIVGVERIIGSAFNDYIRGDEASNVLRGGDGRDDIYGDAGKDRIYGEASRDHLYGGRGDDALYGGDDVDWLNGGPGDDLLDGGDGDDYVMYDTAASGVVVNLRSGTATGEGNDTLISIKSVFGSQFDDVLIGDANGNYFVAGPGDDVLRGGGGNDSLVGGAGDDLIDGGKGFDNAEYYDSPSGIVANLMTGTVTGEGFDTLHSIEGIRGSDHDDTMFGNAKNNFFDGIGGNDYMVGDAGNDYLRVAPGTHIIDGGSGEDILVLRSNFDTQTGATFNLATAQASDEYADYGIGQIKVSGIEHVQGHYYDDHLTGDSGANILAGYAGDDVLDGAGGDDILYGDGSFLLPRSDTIEVIEDEFYSGNDTLRGGAGDDILYGAWGDDILNGGAQDDVLHGGDGFDLLKGGNGADTMYGDNGGDKMLGGEGDDVIFGNAGLDKVHGGLGNDVLRGGQGNDDLFGEEGADTISGGSKADLLDGGAGRDMLEGGGGNDTIHGGSSGDTIKGNSGGDVLFGEAGNDDLSGHKGNDWISGGSGNDTMSGNLGDDTFFFGAGSGDDIISDFEHGDTIAFDSALGLIFGDLVIDTVGDVSTITWGTGDSIEVHGAAATSLTGADFDFGASASMLEAKEALGILSEAGSYEPSFGAFEAKWGGDMSGLAMMIDGSIAS